MTLQRGAVLTAVLDSRSASGLFRHKRRMELDELSGRITGRLGYTWPTTAYAIGGTATLALRYSIISATAAARTRPPGRLQAGKGCWGWAPPPLPPGPQDLPSPGRRDYGPDGAAGGLKPEYTAASGRHDHATTGAGRRPGLGARLFATSDDARAGWYISAYSAFLFRTGHRLSVGSCLLFQGRGFNVTLLSKRRYV